MDIPDRPEDRPYHFHVYDYAGSRAFKPSRRVGNSKRFYSLVADLKQLEINAKAKKIPNVALTQLTPQTVGKRYIYALSFGGLQNDPPQVLFTGGIHAREWVAVEIPYLIAEYLIKNYPGPKDKDKKLTPKQIEIQEEILDLVSLRKIVVAPMLNPDGHTWSVFHDRLWRKNRRSLDRRDPFTTKNGFERDGPEIFYRANQYKHPRGNVTQKISWLKSKSFRGVDLNRNFHHQFWGYETYYTYGNAKGTSGYPGDNTFFGVGYYNSRERETKAIEAQIQELKKTLAASIDFHAYGRFILYPELAKEAKHLMEIGGGMEGVIPAEHQSYRFERPSKSFYPGFGSVMDYSYDSQDASSKVAFTIELDPQLYGTKFPFALPEDKIQGVFEKNIRAVLGLIKCADAHETTTIKNFFAHFENNWNVSDRGNKLPVQ